ncbi:MAG TPA: EAL domain-containing protein [Tianweitania sediminis]|jgi:EAL domain-containing protein (putative c-di-GMP-specific phosphodiesterase class I)|nr:EAL domain-containing protein [Tianweitania sediminis]
MIDATAVSQAILVDEIGLASATFGPFMLKSVFQPIFAAAGDELAPWGAEAKLRPLRDHLPVPSAMIAESMGGEDVIAFEALCRALHLQNYHMIGVDGLSLFCSVDARHASSANRALDELEFLSALVHEVGLPPHLLVCSLAECEKQEKTVLLRLATAIRLHGFSLGVDDFAAGFPALEQVSFIKPDVVKIDGPWFRRVAGVPRATRLLRPLFSGFQDAGAAVLVDGIETASQLDAALEAGAVLVQGPLLGQPMLAGSLFPAAPIERATLTGPQGNVVRLADRRRRMNQRR